jgi:hypothetical protein
LLALCLAVAASAARRLAPPTGDAGGLALLARVHRAYVGVPAVEVSGRVGSLSFRITLVLGSAIGIAEQFVGREPSGTTMLVAMRGPTFAREPGSSCWRRLPASAPQSFGNIGLHFPDQPGMTVKAPRRTSAGWLLPVVIDGGPATFAIDGKSMLIRSITITAQQGSRIVEQVGALRSVPRLLVPEPRC